VLPSFFSPNASTGVYWSRPELYNRDRPLFKRYIPVIRRIAEAGWQPLTWAQSNDEAIWVERYGNEQEAFFTVFNAGDQIKEAVVRVDLGRVLGGRAGKAELLLPTPGPIALSPSGEVRVRLEPEQVAVIRVTPA
jgi:hypothetical protein